jgi:histidyl-tRNA synthetase
MAAKNKKPQRLKARQPRGFQDRMAGDIRATDEMLRKIREVFERYGFDPVETPMFEYTDALGKFLPDTDRPNEGVFSLQDDDEQWMSLRYDMTAPLARHFAQNINELQTPYRTYRAGYVFRNEKPGPGRFRQFMQFDADTVGASGPAADAEMAMMMADTMEALGVARGDYVVRVNDRRVLDGVMDALGIEEPEKRLGVLRSIDKLDKFGIEGVRGLLVKWRLDESGDFTKGVGLEEGKIDFLMFCFEELDLSNILAGSSEDVNSWFSGFFDGRMRGVSVTEKATLTGQIPSQTLHGLASLKAVQLQAEACGYGSDRIRIDPSCVRGLEYYTGTVFECELTFPVTNEKGETVTFGAVAGGGRYDGLVKRFTGQDVPATGFSIGVSRLATALKNLGKLDTAAPVGPVVVTVMDRDAEALAGYQKLVQELRTAGIRAEMYQGNPKNFGKQLQYADRRNSPVAIIQGSAERANGEVQVKDLIEGARLAEGITDHTEWRGEGGARPAQQTVKVEDMVETVRGILGLGDNG